MHALDLDIDVTDAAQIGEPAHLAVSITLPDADRLSDPPIVCFAKPGATASRAYYTLDLPGPGKGAQATWHAERGWVFIAVDHLGTGASTIPDPSLTDFETVTRSADAAEREILRRLADGSLVDDFPAIVDPVVIGIGQSMGGCLTVVQQAHRRTYDGIGVLGYGVRRTHPPTPPGREPMVQAWRARGSDLVMNEGLAGDSSSPDARKAALEFVSWSMFHDDIDRDVVRFGDPSSPWTSIPTPGALKWVTTPGAVAPEAASIRCPVLVAMGDRDVVTDPPGEVREYLSSPSVDLFICPTMAHMHNFAGTRVLFWRRIETWAAWVAAQRDGAVAPLADDGRDDPAG
jgi:alpha-beta hydrolase superfamily lysophospholipase